MSSHTKTGAAPLLALGALGVVFGDIATSPLYAFGQCFLGDSAPKPTPENVLAITSMFFWTLIGVVCIKYATFIMRADHDGEGGTLALLGLIYPTSPIKAATQKRLPFIALVILFGTAALYGDGVITPAISVLSAVEGLDVAAPGALHLAVPITVLILIALFVVQPRGTGKIGTFFGPVMLVWCIACVALGVNSIVHHPGILAALNPLHALHFVLHPSLMVIVVLGATVLCVSGAEAMYADLGHFGIKAIRTAWYVAVFPALACAYLGQGALALNSPKSLDFYAMVPSWGVMPMVVLATAATVIASQALIAGAFSITQQAVQLGYIPRLSVIHTSDEQAGQIYIPFVNVVLGILCVLLVVVFRHSANLGDAYGLAVTLTMISTTIAFAAFTNRAWHWPIWQTVLVTAFFLCFDGSFLVGNIFKIPTGGWIPLTIAIVVFAIFVVWNIGRRRQARAFEKMSVPVEEFMKDLDARPPTKLVGTAVFLTAHPTGVPYALTHQWLRTHVTFETVVLLTIIYERRPRVPPEDRIQLEALRQGSFYRVTAHYGFMETPKTGEILVLCKSKAKDSVFDDTVFYLAESTLVRGGEGHRLMAWQRVLFAWMVTNALPIEAVLDIPPDRVVKIGVEVPV
ncbi:MAG: KUP/HAK/KT family potassium transporter [Vulcanimicrobiaceae bacterium]|jgi:KUP system potassium uptake protein